MSRESVHIILDTSNFFHLCNFRLSSSSSTARQLTCRLTAYSRSEFAYTPIHPSSVVSKKVEIKMEGKCHGLKGKRFALSVGAERFEV